MSQPPEAPAQAPPSAEIEAEARRIVEAAIAQGLRVRLMGGIAILIQSQTASRPPYKRQYRDFDLVAHAKDVTSLRRLLDGEGYVGDKLFNAIHGAQRLVYAAADGRWSIDIVIDRLVMSQTLELRDRLLTDGPTLDLADLLLTKLQIWETNQKDIGDAVCLLADHPLASVGRLAAAPGPDGLPAPIDLARIRAVLGADWGFCHTAERNLKAVAELAARQPVTDARYPVADQVAALLVEIAAAPKSLGWRARASVGERVRWYETPEEARR
jgi:hypothetical protein